MFFAAKQDAKDFFKFSAFSGLDTKYEFRDLGFCCENENNKIAPTWSDVHSWTMVEDYFVIYLDYFNFIALPLEKLTVTGTDLVIQLLKDSGLTRSGNVRK